MIEGEAGNCRAAAEALLSRYPDVASRSRIEEPIVRKASFDIKTILEALKGESKSMLIIGCKSVLSYTVFCKQLFGYGSPDFIMETELLGLQTVYTRGNISHWLNHDLFESTVQACHDFAGNLFGREVLVSVEAVGYSKGNTCFNFHGLIYLDDGSTVNEQTLSMGFCKILPSSVFWNYEGTGGTRSLHRSLFPYNRHLGTSLQSPTTSYHLGDMEMRLLSAERDAANARIGLWTQAELPESLLPDRQEETSKRLLYIDNSNFWISGKHFSGDLKGLGHEDLRRRSLNLSRMDVTMQKHRIERSNVYHNFVFGRRPYYASDHCWRVDYERLLNLVGWNREVDPRWVIAGSIPPENTSVWDSFADLGADRVLTHRTVENKASSEDQSLTARLTDCTKKKFSKTYDLQDNDDIVLFGGDRCYKSTINQILENCPNNRVFILTWGTSACYHGLKLKFSDRVFFINLEPYIDKLFYDSKLVQELHGADSIKRAGEEERLIRFECKTFHMTTVDTIAFITNQTSQKLVVNVHYSLRSTKAYLFIIFRSQDDIALHWMGRIRDALSEHNKVLVPATKNGVASTGSRFSLLDFDDDEDDEEEGPPYCDDDEEVNNVNAITSRRLYNDFVVVMNAGRER